MDSQHDTPGENGNSAVPSAASTPSARWQQISIHRRRRIGVMAVFAIGGVIAVVASWIGATGTRVLSDQLSYIASGGVFGLALLGIAGAILLSDYMVENESRLDQLQRSLDELRAERRAGTAPATSAWASDDHDHSDAGFLPAIAPLVAVEGARRYHRSDCTLIAGKRSAFAVTPGDVATRGLEPCRVCSPAVEPVSAN